jgi:hypothetical protein
MTHLYLVPDSSIIHNIVYCISRVEIEFSTRGMHDIFPTTTKKKRSCSVFLQTSNIIRQSCGQNIHWWLWLLQLYAMISLRTG